MVGCATPVTYTGRVIDKSGNPIKHVKVEARDYISLLNTSPWNWGPGWKICASTETDRKGYFELKVPKDDCDGLYVIGDSIFSSFPRPRQTNDIVLTVGPLPK